MLSFLLKLLIVDWISLQSFFSSCGSVDKAGAELVIEQRGVRKILVKHKFDFYKNRSVLLPEILKVMDERRQWLFKIYLKLVYGFSLSTVSLEERATE